MFEAIQNEVLKQAVSQILKDFGSEEFIVRDEAEKRAKALPIKAIPFLKEGLKSDIPDVRIGADNALRHIRGANLTKCLEPVDALYDGLTKMNVSLDFQDNPALRKKYEEKIKLADGLKLSQEELDLAFDTMRTPEPGEPGSLDSLNRKYQLQDAHSQKSKIRLWYACHLVETGKQEDVNLAKSLLIEAVKLPGWQTAPGLIVTCVDKVGIPLAEWPKEVQDAYKASILKIQSYNKDAKGWHFSPRPK